MNNALVKIDGNIYSKIEKGLVAFAGISENDDKETVDFMCDKMLNL